MRDTRFLLTRHMRPSASFSVMRCDGSAEVLQRLKLQGLSHPSRVSIFRYSFKTGLILSYQDGPVTAKEQRMIVGHSAE